MRLIDANALHKEISEWPESVMYKDWVQAAIANAQTITPPPNAPLTLDELREMDGGPVWCEKFEWRICYGVSDFRGCLCMETGAGSCIQLNDYGKTWRAYRCRPEEGG